MKRHRQIEVESFLVEFQLPAGWYPTGQSFRWTCLRPFWHEGGAMGEEQLAVRIVRRINEVPREAWDSLLRDGSPFMRWDWLDCLEDTGLRL